MSSKNLTFHLAERPTGNIVPGRTFKLVETDAPTADKLKDGEILVEVIYLSLDPALRIWLHDFRSYIPALKIDEKIRGSAITRVLASKSPKAKQGDLVFAHSGWTEYAIVDENNFFPIDLPQGAQLTDFLGAIGVTGLTAYFGLEKVGNPQPGETVVVSGAAGATGIIVGQIAKIRGSRVIGIAGSDEKCDILTKELGFNVALNYKKASFREEFERATPGLVDLYWDNVGGEILELALERAAKRARFVMCGGTSEYNSLGGEAKPGVRNLLQVVINRIRMEGFIAFDYVDEYPQARVELGKWLAEGKIKRKETILKGGLKVAETGIGDLFAGKNVGKMIVEVKPLE
ncbi:uncharacterized protein F4822DRAFT_432478 [Hypoxylon trugodes]|uniref:uncharacterized protein n=1 Tax=Hypoxylon trugodes TaxID=326681 RepID=UPI00219A86CF|nr:uncharacterized protein F4822DRAFT_432478 [Hypoxylon trugodes]KAI1385623.1 hypothetical protein F4822DRAFT_432478 [Hypoxylon trugodes]